MSQQVHVVLSRVVSYRETEDAPELAYGPGRALIPLPLAESLMEWGMISEWSDQPPTDPDTFPIKPSDELATSFPAREYLYMAGYTSYGQVAELELEDLTALPGIGEATAGKILAAMAEAKKRMPQEANKGESDGTHTDTE